MSYREEIQKKDLIRSHVTRKADIRFTDGALPHALGVTNIQIMRSTQDPKTAPDGLGWTYAHAPNIAYWQGELMVQYLANPISEHEGNTVVFLIRSKDGVHFSKPEEIFPAKNVPVAPYNGEAKEHLFNETTHCVIHQRMSFYKASNGKMLAMTYYGISPTDPRLNSPELPPVGSVKTWNMTDMSLVMPGSGYGVGRAIREIKKDFSFGPVFMLRYDSSGGYTRKNTDIFPYYEESTDEAFKEACHDLMKNRCVTQQWWEEERFDESGFFTLPPGEAPCIYTLPGDGKDKICIMKNALVTISHDNGETWTQAVRSHTLETSTGKVWGQKGNDGSYVLAYNPSTDTAHRWPLAVATGSNGQDFGELYSVLPIVPVCRYAGRLKNLGPQYIRGIGEYNPRPEDNAFYLTYSNNKEDIWVSRIALPLRGYETKDVCDVMGDTKWSEIADSWNLMIPSWGGLELENGALELSDKDPYQCAIAERAFVPAVLFDAELDIAISEIPEGGCFTIAFSDDSGKEPVKIVFRENGFVNSRVFGSELHIFKYIPNKKIHFIFHFDCVKNEVRVEIFSGSTTAVKKWRFDNSVANLCRVQFRTKYQQMTNDEETYAKWGDIGNLKGADYPIDETKVRIYSFKTKTIETE